MGGYLETETINIISKHKVNFVVFDGNVVEGLWGFLLFLLYFYLQLFEFIEGDGIFACYLEPVVEGGGLVGDLVIWWDIAKGT